MSAVENGPQQGEARSSVAIAVNAKGDAQPVVKIYDGCTPEEASRLSALAVATLEETIRGIKDLYDRQNRAALEASAAA